jgi:hypothetical protein
MASTPAMATNEISPERRPRELRRLMLYVGLFFVIWSLRAIGLAALDRAALPLVSRRIYLDGIRFLLWVLPVFLYLHYIDGVRPATYLKLSTPVKLSVLPWCQRTMASGHGDVERRRLSCRAGLRSSGPRQ